MNNEPQEHPSIKAIRQSLRIMRVEGAINDALFKYIDGQLDILSASVREDEPIPNDESFFDIK